MSPSPTTESILKRHREVIPGGVVSLNRAIQPMRLFVRAKGAYLWDHDGNRFIDYHGAFSPYLLGHGDEDVDAAVIEAIRSGQSLIGAGTTPWEGELAQLLVECVPTLDQVQLTNTGSEATYFALRVARAATGRDGIIIMQGGYNGWHNDVAFNLMDPASRLSGCRPGEEIPLSPISSGIPQAVRVNIHPVEYNDLPAVERLLESGTIGAVLLEPVLQNVGIIKPEPGYLEGLRRACDRSGALLIFDEVKTGFRHALGGYQSLCGVRPDLSTFGKAVANGYPLGVIGGKRDYMGYFNHEDPAKRVLMAGTYNGHPVPVAAARATLRKLRDRGAEIYPRLDALGRRMEEGLAVLLNESGIPATIVRQGSAFVVYFMERAPRSWREVAENNRMDFDAAYRRALIEAGIFHFPTPTKQGSICFAHTEQDIDDTLAKTREVLKKLA
ncbi:MAG: aspartate aminotransferase family protein [Puniceicoccaceae bacterium]|nr:MAG: aspartate aminotransferase family protein [Puniceicoccaceae bacterium]